jgi:gliding motility-associated-like protein
MRNLLIFLTCLAFSPLFAQVKNPAVGFIENKNQIIDQNGRPNPLVRYLLNTNGLNVQLRQNGFSYDIYETKNHPIDPKQNMPADFIEDGTVKRPGYTFENTCHRVDIDFAGCNKDVQLIAEGKSADCYSYYNLAYAPDGITDIHKFQKVTYRNIYDNIDVLFFIPEDNTKPVEYNFIIKPGGNIADIRLKFSGAKTALLDNKITMKLRFGPMEETLPQSWYEAGSGKEEIAIGYKKVGSNLYGFESPQIAPDKTVIIDPVPVRLWGTYYGGSAVEYTGSVMVDSSNHAVISGSTGSSDNIATAGPNTSGYFAGTSFIAKYLPDGTRIWSSYYPFPTGSMKIDSNDNLYLFGNILNANTTIPSPGCHQPVKDVYNSGYLIKLNSVGAKLWGTYYGGNQNEVIYGLTVDSSSNIYIVGGTSSNDAFSTPGAFQVTKGSPGTLQTGFVAKFDSAGTRIWGTFYGGTLADGFFDCDIASDGFLYAIGTHNSLNNIATPGTYEPTTASSGGMIVKFDLNGNRIWGTFIADNTYLFRGRIKGDEMILSGRCFSSASALGTPGTMSQNFITPLPPGSVLSSNENNFISKFNFQTQQYLWGTYFFEQIVDLDLDSSDNIFFCGYTGIDTGLTTPDAYMPTKTFYQKSYLIKMNPQGQKTWGTYYGGNYAEQECYVKLDHNNDIYLYGATNGSTTGIATVGASQTTLGSNPDNYLVLFRDCLSSTVASSNSPICIGSPLNLTASGGTGYAWTGPNGFTSSQQNPTIPNAAAANSGQYFCTITGTGGCDGSNTVTVVVGDTAKPIPDLPTLPAISGDCNTVITIPTATDYCAGAITATTADPLAYPVPGTYTVHWKYDDGNGNIEIQNQTVTITAVALPAAATPQVFCIQQNATLAAIAITGQNIKWYTALTGGSTRPANTPLVNNTIYYASQTISSCESVRVPVKVNIQQTLAPVGSSPQSFCSVQNATLSTIAITGNAIVWYTSAAGNTTLPNTTTLANATTYYATQNINGCESVNRLPVVINLINTLNAYDYAETICDDGNDGSETVDLSGYNALVIANTANCTFDYYKTLSGADNQAAGDSIAITANYLLRLGLNTVYIRITSANGCHQVVRLDLTVVAKPIISLTDIVPICEGNTITVDAGAGNDSYVWSDGSTGQTLTISQADDYWVTATKNHGAVACSTTKNFSVVLSNIATITGIEAHDWTDTENVITVNTAGHGDYEFSIDGITYQSQDTFTGLNSGAYTIYVRDRNGCGTVTDEVFLLMYPKFFTPNGDGFNDAWGIRFSSTETGLKVNIFDRYGKLLKELGNAKSWNGKFNDKDLPSDDYWFTVTRANGKEYRNHFTLKR